MRGFVYLGMGTDLENLNERLGKATEAISRARPTIEDLVKATRIASEALAKTGRSYPVVAELRGRFSQLAKDASR